MPNINTPQAILFDMGGVLVDPADRWDARQFQISFPEGLPDSHPSAPFLELSAEVMNAFLNLPIPRPVLNARPFIEVWLWKQGIVPEPALVNFWYDQLCQWEVCPFYPFVETTLRTLRGMGIRLGLVSNTVMPGIRIRRHFEHAGLLALFDAMTFSADAGVNKPDPRIFHIVLNAMNIDPASAWFVGDKPQRDVCGAHAAGMTAVLVDGPNQGHKQDVPENVPEIRIATIAALPELLAGLR